MSSVAAAEQVTVRSCVQAVVKAAWWLVMQFSRMFGDSPGVMLQGCVGSSVD